LEKNQRRFSL